MNFKHPSVLSIVAAVCALLALQPAWSQGLPHHGAEIEAHVVSVDLATSTLVLLGLPVVIHDATSFNDDLEELKPFGLAAIKPGDYVEIQGVEEPLGRRTVRAIRVERKQPKAQVQLEGTVETIDPSTRRLLILGKTIQATATATYLDAYRRRISAEEFFSQAQGTRVDTFGLWDGSVLTATRLELND